MLNNDNGYMAFNSYDEMPELPYKIIEVLLKDNSQASEDFWKILNYIDMDSLDYPNLTYEEKKSLIWKNEPLQQKFKVFLKPLIGDSLEDSEAQTQIRLSRYSTNPEDNYYATICFEINFITNEKTSMVYYNDMICDRTDVLESLFLKVMNGRDIGIGSNVLQFNRKLSRSCNSQLNIGNSKSFYGRSLIIALTFSNCEVGDTCG